MTEVERLRAEVEALKMICASIFQEAPPQFSKAMRKAARDAMKAQTGLTDDQVAVMQRVVLLTSGSVSQDDLRVPREPKGLKGPKEAKEAKRSSAPSQPAATSGVILPST